MPPRAVSSPPRFYRCRPCYTCECIFGAGWGRYVDLEVDCGLYFCQYTLDQVVHQEVEASSVHVLLSGESSFKEYERDSAGELTLDLKNSDLP